MSKKKKNRKVSKAKPRHTVVKEVTPSKFKGLNNKELSLLILSHEWTENKVFTAEDQLIDEVITRLMEGFEEEQGSSTIEAGTMLATVGHEEPLVLIKNEPEPEPEDPTYVAPDDSLEALVYVTKILKEMTVEVLKAKSPELALTFNLFFELHAAVMQQQTTSKFLNDFLFMVYSKLVPECSDKQRVTMFYEVFTKEN